VSAPFSIGDVVAAVKADFQARGITATVEFGSWKVPMAKAANKVIFGLGSFSFEPPGPPNAPGVLPIDDPVTQAARSLMTRVQYVPVLVHGPAPDARDENRSEKAQAATDLLLQQTLAALYRYAHGSFGWGNGQWVQPENQDFLYGAVATFEAQFSIPVLDDPMPVIGVDIEGSTAQTYAVFPSGEVLVSETP